MSELKVFGFDTETYWDDEVSVVTMGSYAYARHPLTRCYIMSGATNLGHTYAGSPDEFDFSAVTGPDWVWLSHNVGFDMQAYARLHEENPEAFPWPQGHWYDTADLASYCGLPRSLKGAIFEAFGIVHDKTLRDKDTKGKQWHEFEPQLKTDFTKYALDDAVHMLRLWMEYSPRWPEEERKISELSCLWAAAGLVTNKAYIADRTTYLNGIVTRAANDIPWVADGKKPLSKKELAIACRASGIPCPKSVAIDDEECEEWLDTYGDKYPWVMAARDWRRANAIQKKLQAITVRTTNRFHYEIKYWGAGITGRWSGAGGVNVQNLSGKELYGVNMRKTVIAGPGKKLCAADLEQIEPRCGCWFADEREALIELAAGVSPYIVYARQAMGLAHNETWAKSDPRYKVAKEAVLGCGYSMGHHKFVITIEGKVPQGRLTEDEVVAILDSPLEWEGTEEKYFDYIDSIKRPQWLSFYQKQDTAGQHRLFKGWEIVMTFRNGRPKLVTLWKSLGQAAKEAAARGEDLELGLPSGRSLIYKKCRFRRKPKTEESPEGGHDIVADITRNGIPQTTKIHSGILIENMCQAMARDSFRDCLLRVHDAGYKVLFHVHDELIVELDEDGAEEAKLDIERIMGIHPTWAPTLPVAAEATLADSYDQAK